MDDSPVTQRSLLVRIRDPQNHVSWQEFVEIYAPLVRNYCTRRGLQRADAADVSQEVMQAVATAIQKFEYDPERGSFRGWLFTITSRKLNNFFARSKRQPRGSGATAVQQLLENQPDREGEEDWEKEYRRFLFHWAAEKIRPEFQETTWRAFWKVTVEEEPVKQAADELDLTAGAVYIAKSRVLKRLTERIQQVTG